MVYKCVANKTWLMLSICDAINSNIAKVMLLVVVCKELKGESKRTQFFLVFFFTKPWPVGKSALSSWH